MSVLAGEYRLKGCTALFDDFRIGGVKSYANTPNTTATGADAAVSEIEAEKVRILLGWKLGEFMRLCTGTVAVFMRSRPDAILSLPPARNSPARDVSLLRDLAIAVACLNEFHDFENFIPRPQGPHRWR
jgi:hypothetical protein